MHPKILLLDGRMAGRKSGWLGASSGKGCSLKRPGGSSISDSVATERALANQLAEVDWLARRNLKPFLATPPAAPNRANTTLQGMVGTSSAPLILSGECWASEAPNVRDQTVHGEFFWATNKHVQSWSALRR
ncbi:hypothetical protein EMPG_16274 [Blastomyces silverae]|uniref:Uncharacterized protein n=1 Tax=Blastomyces silverae TaxID=2060906 RepID=A0A0H1BA46_9EURO|nr:hypothetical protein EMPG_16274 [Blastomyces silverae]